MTGTPHSFPPQSHAEPFLQLPVPPGTFQQVRSILARMHGWPGRRILLGLVIGLVGVIVGNMGGQIWLTSWQGDFYNAIEKHDASAFFYNALRYLYIAGTLLSMIVFQTWFTEIIKIRLRSFLTEGLLDDWLKPKRAYLLNFAGEIGANPDQRIHEDARHLAELTADLGASLLQAGLLLIAFIGVLWILSSSVSLPIAGYQVVIPGYMVWCALLFAAAGSTLTLIVGRPMVEDNANRYAREAEMRFSLVRVAESAEGITLYGGEADEKRVINLVFGGVTDAMRRLANDLARLTWVTSGYGWLALLVPTVVAAPGYFTGSLTLGGLMMVVNSFNQVQSSLRWFVDNFSRLADWRATLKRVEGLREALNALDRPNGVRGHIDLVEDEPNRLVFKDFELTLPDGKAEFADAAAVEAGERVQVTGEIAAGKSTLLLALAGLWSRGRGSIHRPHRDDMMFLSERPYFPLGSLASALAYPEPAMRYPREAYEHALLAVGMKRMAANLGDIERWDKRLGLDDQQVLAFARLILHRPPWVVMDDAMSALSPDHRRRIFAALKRLDNLTVVSLTREEEAHAFFDRQIHLQRSAGRGVRRGRPRKLMTQ
ncbi:MAG: ABC transporter ATP-binding protein/permease [Ancalomicrobiaceae bacterium]|nr:ABC transporter ATP-binding protein/permease [Ancalomicrobiaceae bacterium]